ncbi:MAG: methyl-accepting chemotaxis protein [candidate division WOR-3 bacterium]
MNSKWTIKRYLSVIFLTQCAILVLVGIVGYYSSNVGYTGMQSTRDLILPMLNVLKIRDQIPRINGEENILLATNLDIETKANSYKIFDEAKGVIEESQKIAESIKKSIEAEKMYSDYKKAMEDWWKHHEEYLKTAKEFDSYGLPNPTAVQRDIKGALAELYNIETMLLYSILRGEGFENIPEDPAQCKIGKWLNTFKTQNQEINTSLERIKQSHNDLYSVINNIKKHYLADKEKAEELLFTSFIPIVITMAKDLENIYNISSKANEAYAVMSDYSTKTIRASYEKAREAIQKFSDIMEQDAKNLVASIGAKSNFTRWLSLGINVVGIIMAVSLGILFTRLISNTLNSISSRIKEGSIQVNTAAEQVSQASQSLAASASEQASSNEETSASLEELTSMIQQNASNAAQTEQMTKETHSIILQCVESMQNLLANMESLQRSSAETAGIIKTIDEIAFQTNLLALNAAVEAARAGEAGKGFAVVAEEVRRLAQRSAEAAKNTQQIIENTIKKSNDSAVMSKEVGEMLQKLRENAEKVLVLVQEVSTASNEQAKGVEQINTAMMEINKSTQEVAANSEETASSSEELTAQANELLSLVGELEKLVSGRTSIDKTKISTIGVKKNKFSTFLSSHTPIQQKSDRRRAVKSLAKVNNTSGELVKPEEVIPLDEEELKEF